MAGRSRAHATSKRSTKATMLPSPVTTPRRSRQALSSPNSAVPSPTATPSVSALLSQSQLTTDEWYKSPNTTKAYTRYVKSGKEFLNSWAEETVDAGSEDVSCDGQEEDRSSFAVAFDVIGLKTPIALRLLTAYKCDHQGRAFATADSLRSAFKLYFERVHQCQGEFWKFNSATQEWDGNPVFDPEYKTYYESLKNRDKRTGSSAQALPMLPGDLKVVMQYLDSEEAAKALGETKCLYFKAFATTAFNLWTRNDELVNLQFKHIWPNCVSRSGHPYVEITLVFRKTNKDPNKAQQYNIPPDPAHPEIDCYSHLNRWTEHLSSILGRSLAGDDYVFPAIASTNLVKFGEPTSRSAIEALLELVVENSAVMKERNGKFTTHCFRRGGAQYRFMWAERKWSLKAVKWWGGWSSSEHVGTIMRYLLDELTAYEEGFSDILLSDRASDRHETFMGSQSMSSTVSHADLQTFGVSLIKQFQDLLPASLALCSARPQIQYAQCSPQVPMPSSPHIPMPSTCQRPPPASPSPARARPHPRSRIPRIPKTTSLDDALQYWEEGDVKRGLITPLKSWATIYQPADYRSEAQKLSMIRILRDEFVEHCDHDWEVFEELYPGLRYQYTKLIKAVRKARVVRGDVKPRRALRP